MKSFLKFSLSCVLLSLAIPPVAAEQFEVRSVFDLTESEWNELETITEAAHFPRESLLRVLNRLRQRHVAGLLHEQSTGDPSRLDSLRQGDAVDFSQNAEVESVQRFDFPPFRTLPEFDHFYISRLKIAGHFDAVCISSQVPRGWNITESTGSASTGSASTEIASTENVTALFHRFEPPERSGFHGILLAPGKTPVFAASRLEWFPNTLLGDHGMDVALFDAVAPISPEEWTVQEKPTPERLQTLRQSLKLTDADREPFYRLLTTVAEISGSEIDRSVPLGKFSVVELFNRPQFLQGELVRLTGYARRIERVNIDDPDILQQFGIDHYYQIALFTDDSQGNPLFFCIREIPSGLPLGEKEGFPVSLSISGVFYKTWAYRKIGDDNQAEERGQRSLTQLAPLLIGAKIDWFRPQEGPGSSVNSFAPLYSSAITFLALAVSWVLLRRFRNRSGPIRFPLQENIEKKAK